MFIARENAGQFPDTGSFSCCFILSSPGTMPRQDFFLTILYSSVSMTTFTLVRSRGCLYVCCSFVHLPKKQIYNVKKVSEWGNFLLNFLGQYDMVHNHKTTTVMHILIKGPPPFRVQTSRSSCPLLAGVWPRPGSGILVYLSPGLGHPRTPTPPSPPTPKWVTPSPLLPLCLFL